MSLDRLKKLKKLKGRSGTARSLSEQEYLGISEKERKKYLTSGWKKMQSIAEDESLTRKEKACFGNTGMR